MLRTRSQKRPSQYTNSRFSFLALKSEDEENHGMNNIHSSQVPSFRGLAPQFNLSQWPCITGSGRPPIAHIAPQSPTLGQIILGGLVLVGVGYVAYKIIVGPQERRLHCSECGRASHTARNCPFTGARRRFSSSAEKTGWCECCGDWFPRTQLHHYGGRADDSKAMEMCQECHVHCGHDGHTRYFAIKPRYCRVAA